MLIKYSGKYVKIYFMKITYVFLYWHLYDFDRDLFISAGFHSRGKAGGR